MAPKYLTMNWESENLAERWKLFKKKVKLMCEDNEEASLLSQGNNKWHKWKYHAPTLQNKVFMFSALLLNDSVNALYFRSCRVFFIEL